MTKKDEAVRYALSFPDTYQETLRHGGGRTSVRVMGAKKIFLSIAEESGQARADFKADPELQELWRSAYAAVIPSCHFSPAHWSTVILDGTVPGDKIREMIRESYRTVTDSPTKRIYEAVKKIPRGKVATYGQVAALAGNPRMSRAVGNALHKNRDPEHVPCYRVVNAKGELAEEFVFGGAGVQEGMLRADGIEVKGRRVDLEKYGIRPDQIKG